MFRKNLLYIANTVDYMTYSILYYAHIMHKPFDQMIFKMIKETNLSQVCPNL